MPGVSTIETVAVSGHLAVSLSLLGTRAPKELASLGSRELLDRTYLGFLCSARCSGAAILAAYEVSKKLDPADGAVIGGFHSPMERQFLETLLIRRVPAVVCVPRPLRGMRVPAHWKSAMAEGRLLIVSSAGSGTRRFSRSMAELRNAVVSAIADTIFVPFASPGGSTEKLLSICASWGKTVLTVACNDQPMVRAAGAGDIEEWMRLRTRGGGERTLVLL